MRFRVMWFLTLLIPLLAWWGSGSNTPAVSSFEGVVFENQVVRAYYTDPGMVTYISSWRAPWEVNKEEKYLVIDVTPEEYKYLENLGYKLVVDQELTTFYQRPAKKSADQLAGIPGYACYRTVEETLSTAQSIATNYPQLATRIDIGNSWAKTQNSSAGYDLVVLKLTNSAIAGPKPVFFATSAIHAREYATAELNTRFAEYLVNNYGTNADVTWLLDYHEVHLLLQANPDGRKQAEAGALWRKNTNQNYCGATSSSRGADLNRNFSFQWGAHGGSSTSQCSDTYRGPAAASEPEVQAIQNYGLSIFPDWRDDPLSSGAPLNATGAYVDIHSYGQLVLWPWGFNANTANDAQFQTFGRKLAYFNSSTPQQAVDLYVTDGTTDDFFYGKLGVAAMTFELGTAFFQSCSTFESTHYPTNLQALIYMAKSARAPYALPAGPDSLNVAVSSPSVPAGTNVTLTAQANDTRYNNSNGTEATQNIAAAEYYIDTPYWVSSPAPVARPMTASDGSFNQKTENVTATINTTGLAAGKHIIYVRSRDTSGNWGVVSAVFLTITSGGPTPTPTRTPTPGPTSTPIPGPTSTPTAPAPTATPGGNIVFTGSLTSGGSAIHPTGSYYYSTTSGLHYGRLVGPSGTDFDLRLQKWNGSTWAQVASATGSTSTETINYNGTAGYYRWQVNSYSGSGSYTLTTTRPN